MKKSLQPTKTGLFNFNGSSLHALTDQEGEIWFIAKDVCDILGIKNPTLAVKKLEDVERALYHLGRQGFGNIVNESGLYKIIFNSRKPAAIEFQTWVTSQVIPSIRKTGQYQMAPVQQPVTQLSLAEIATEAKAIHDLATLFGLTGNHALLRTDKIVHERHGVSPLKLLNVDLVAPSKEKTFNPTNLGLQLNPTKTGQWVNNRLQALGFQDKVKIKYGHEWNPTPMGRQHCEVIDTGKAHSNGAPILQIKWYHSVVQYLGDL